MLTRKMLMTGAALAASAAFAVNFPKAGGDIASNGADGWNGTMPKPDEKAQFNQPGTYTASADVQFGEFSVQANSIFDLGERTAKISKFYMGYYIRNTELKGGLWDVGGVFSSANESGAHTADVLLSNGCVVTNATLLRVAYSTSNNKVRVTDSSHVHANGCVVAYGSASCNALLEVSSGGSVELVNGNFLDTTGLSAADLIEADTTNRVVVTGAGSKIVCPRQLVSSDPRGFVIGNCYGRNSLEVSDGGELTAPFRFGLGYSRCANNNYAVFKTGARFHMSDCCIGEMGSCGNLVEFLSGAEGEMSTGFVGGNSGAGCGNRMVVSNANVKCYQVVLSKDPASCSNSLYIAGSDTCFTTTIHDTPYYPLVTRGRFNSFTLDGATWNYWLHMWTDQAASSNSISLVNGAALNLGGGLTTGTNGVESCGNRILVAGGSAFRGQFLWLSRRDNVLTVSNATVDVASDDSRYGNVAVGTTMVNVGASAIGDNGLVLQGDSPRVSASSGISFENGSFLRVEVPASGYVSGNALMTGKTLTFDSSSRLHFDGVAGLQRTLGPGVRIVLAQTTDGVTVPDDVLAAANAELAAAGDKARLYVSSDGKSLVLKVIGNNGLIMLIR